MTPNQDFKVTVFYKGGYLLNLQFEVPLTYGISAIAQSLVD